MTTKSRLIAIETQLLQIRADAERGLISRSEAEELLADINLATVVAESAEDLRDRARVQTVLENTITVVSALA